MPIKNTMTDLLGELQTVVWGGVDIFQMADDESGNTYGDKFPLVTVYRIGERARSGWQKIWVGQITIWGKTYSSIDALKTTIIDGLNHTQKENKWEMCQLVVETDRYDSGVKIRGIPITITLQVRDKEF